MPLKISILIIGTPPLTQLMRGLNLGKYFARNSEKVLECEGNSGEFVELVPEQLNYLGPKDLTQYFIRSTQGSVNL